MESGEVSTRSETRIPAPLTAVYGLSPLSCEPTQFQGISPENTHRKMAPCSVLGLLHLPYQSVVPPKAPQSHLIIS